jgi:two-component system, NarL family, captular synthesis response regulator RcsB
MLRVALLDDHPAVLAGLQRLIEPQRDMTVIAAAPTVAELSQQLSGTFADVLVLDFDLARGDGLMHCLRVKHRPGPPAVIIYSAYSGDGLVLAARAAGADCVVDKTEPVQNLLSAIRGAVAGEAAMPTVSRPVYEAAVAGLDDEDLPVLAMLLDRESLDGMAEALGKSRAELAWRSQRIVARLRPMDWRPAGNECSPRLSARGPTSTFVSRSSKGESQ